MSWFEMMSERYPLLSKAYMVVSFLMKRFILGYWETLKELDDIHQELFILRNELKEYREKRERIENERFKKCQNCPALETIQAAGLEE